MRRSAGDGSIHQRKTEVNFSGLEIFTSGRHMLSVFSFKEEAEVFLHPKGAGEGWQTKETKHEELVSVLYGPCRYAEQVSLDPLPEVLEPVGLTREAFVKALLTSDTSSAVEETYMLGIAP